MALQPTQLEKIAGGLAGFSAGLGGQLPQFMYQQQQQQALQQQQEAERMKQQQAAAIERQKTMFVDAQAALGFAEKGDYEQVVNLGLMRLDLLRNFPDADPSDTQRVTQLALAARNGNAEAADLLKAELSNAVEIGRSIGVLTAPETSTKVVGNFLVDDKTGKIVFDASEEGPRERAADQNGVLRYIDDGKPVFPQVEKLDSQLSEGDRFSRASKIRDEITAQTKDFTQIANSWDRIAASADDPSAAGDLALIFNFMKMLDPGSTVREGEFATAQNATGIPTQIRNLYNRASSGERLAEEQRADFFNQAQNIFNASKERADQITSSFVSLGERYGLKPEDVIVERGAVPEISQRAAAGLPVVSDQAQYDALPSGAEFIEDGIRYRKP